MQPSFAKIKGNLGVERPPEAQRRRALPKVALQATSPLSQSANHTAKVTSITNIYFQSLNLSHEHTTC